MVFARLRLAARNLRCASADFVGLLASPIGLFENPVMTNHAPLHPRALIACAAVSIALAAPAAARPRDALYQWTDATGAVRYTTQIERIPASQRGAAVRVASDPSAPRAGGQPAAEAAAQ